MNCRDDLENALKTIVVLIKTSKTKRGNMSMMNNDDDDDDSQRENSDENEINLTIIYVKYFLKTI